MGARADTCAPSVVTQIRWGFSLNVAPLFATLAALFGHLQGLTHLKNRVYGPHQLTPQTLST